MEFEMKKTALAATLLLACAAVFAKPYPKYDVVKSVLHDQGFDGDAADRIREDLADHAGEYPPKFDNEADRKRAEKDAVTLARLYSGLIEQKIVTEKQPEQYRSVLHSIARLNWIAHNLDVPNAAAYADQHYRMLLAALPQKQRAGMQGEYGGFLASVGQTDAAVKMLNEAVQGGSDRSRLPLGMALLSQGKKAESLKQLRAYAKKYPEDERAAKFIDAVENGRFEVRRAEMPKR
jgi:hypothetical protein